jgi:Spy/CpxP family protein refolding chaperone
MNSPKLNFLTILAMLVFAGVGHAQQTQRPPSAEERLSKMKTELGLSDAQVQKIKPLIEANMEKMKAAHDDSSLSEEQKRERMMELKKAGAEAVAAELTPEQKAKFEEEMKKRRQGGPSGGAGGSGGGQGGPGGGQGAPGGKGQKKGPPSAPPKSE